jgi:hypothetical protein
VIPVGLAFAAAGMIFFSVVTPDTPVWMLIVLGVVFGFGLGNTIAPSTTRMTLATPPERSGSGSAVQNTVRQVGAVFGVAILSSIVSTVYSNNITPLLEGKGLPSEAFAAATESIGGTNEVADRLAAAGAAPAQAIGQLRQASIDSFMPAFHTATFFSVGLLALALVIVVIWLPTKAQAAAWSGTAPAAPASADADAGVLPADELVRTADETDGELARVAAYPVSTASDAAGASTAAGGGRHAASDAEPAAPPVGAHHHGRHARPESRDGAAGRR